MRRADMPKSATPHRQQATRSPVAAPSPTRLLQLQRAAGNTAVTTFVQRCGSEPCECNEDGASVQRAPLDPAPAPPAVKTDLTSPRFAGDAVLEACFDDKARLGVGATGDAVLKVQEALTDLGFDLGPGGEDAIYGEGTAAAVRQFKTVHHLGFESFGDVGPGTMRKLDELLPSAPVPSDNGGPTSDETPVDECPADSDIVTALQDNGVAQEPVGVTTTTSASVGDAGGGTGAPPTAHVPIAEAVRIFKSKVNVSNPRPGENITDNGQFFWGSEIESVISAELTGLAGPGTNDFVDKARAVVTLIQKSPLDDSIDAKLLELDAIARKTKDPSAKAKMRSLLTLTVTSPGPAIAGFWTSLNARADDSRPSVSAHSTIRSLRAIRAFEKVGCFDHVGQLAARLSQKGGIKPTPAGAAKFGDVVVGTYGFITDFRPILSPTGLDKASLDAAVDPSGASTFMLGQVITQQGVSSAVAAMRVALDAGQLIHARVISGIGVGHETIEPRKKSKRREGQLSKVYEQDTKDGKHKKGDPKALSTYEEHSVLVIGYDGDLFVFNDPDATQSHSKVGPISEPGFGFLGFDSATGRLGRGATPSDLPVDKDGHTRGGEKRYQVISLHPA